MGFTKDFYMSKRLKNRKPMPEDIDVVILSGGRGLRLSGIVSDKPKPMALVAGSPFLDAIIKYVSGFGFKRFILCTGYMAQAIKEHYKDRQDLTLVFSEEKEPLGTAGAIKNAEPFIHGDMFLAMNGDSICKMDIRDFIDFHALRDAMVSVALAAGAGKSDCGVITLNENGIITSFNEKASSDEHCFLNAGVYVMSKNALSLIPSGRNYSLEYDLLPSILDKEVYGYITEGGFIDIGTPERYKKAEDFLRSL